MTPEGNFEGHNILNRINNLELRDATTEARLTLMREKLLARRAARVRPGFDDKVLADWNGLMIAALAKAADAFDRPDWLAAAERAFAFVSTRMTSGVRLLHSYRAGEAKAPATATDYANMIKAALALASVTGNVDDLNRARAWTQVLDHHYWAEGHGGYFLAADDTGDLIVRTINALDDATPNANGTMVSNLMQLYLWTGEERYRDRAEGIVRGFSGDLSRNVFAHTGLLTGALDLLAPAQIVIVVPEGGDARELRRALANVSLPSAVVQEIRETLRRGERCRVISGAWQDSDRRQADGLCLHRPAMLNAGDRARGAGGGGERGTATPRDVKFRIAATRDAGRTPSPQGGEGNVLRPIENYLRMKPRQKVMRKKAKCAIERRPLTSGDITKSVPRIGTGVSMR